MSLNQDKTEIVFFRKPSKNIPNDIKLKRNGKKLFHEKTVNYLGVTLDEHLNGDYHMNTLVKKLNRAN